MNHLSYFPNPRNFGLSDFEFGLTETGLPTFCNQLTSLRNIRVVNFGPTEMASSYLWLTSDTPRWYFRSHRKSQRSLYLNFRSDRVFTSVSPRWLKYVCNGWILCGGYIYPSTPSSFEERAIRTHTPFQLTCSEREPPTHVLRPRNSNPTTRILISSLPQVSFQIGRASCRERV